MEVFKVNKAEIVAWHYDDLRVGFYIVTNGKVSPTTYFLFPEEIEIIKKYVEVGYETTHVEPEIMKYVLSSR